MLTNLYLSIINIYINLRFNAIIVAIAIIATAVNILINILVKIFKYNILSLFVSIIPPISLYKFYHIITFFKIFSKYYIKK